MVVLFCEPVTVAVAPEVAPTIALVLKIKELASVLVEMIEPVK